MLNCSEASVNRGPCYKDNAWGVWKASVHMEALPCSQTSEQPKLVRREGGDTSETPAPTEMPIKAPGIEALSQGGPNEDKNFSRHQGSSIYILTRV
ncbi:hypothetical protein ElyMa_001047300 [Elysia marginata]|uniref:Uncharacterized protein n=1 Tax=Elysia marginata TaxID=1093978 RepID=A0AAV4HNP5_9GAST|nr:hypothetical protein ElyMa_001047300 [Elysia marginata]